MTTRKKLLIYKILLFVFAFIVAFMPSTISRNKEVNSRVIVEIIGIDGGDKVSVTAQYVMPTGEGNCGAGKDTVTVEGDTLTEAVEALNTALGRRAELGHCSMVVVGADASPQLLGTLMTATDVTADVYLAAAEEKASELVGNITDFMKKTGATDADFIAYSARKAHVATNTLLGFLCDIGSASECGFIPLVQMLESGDSGGGSGGGESSGGSGGESGGSGGESGGQKPEQSGMKVERLVLYGKDGRLGVLESSSARGVAWVSAPIQKGIVIADAEYDGKTVKNVSGTLLKKYVGVKIEPKSDKAVVKVKAVIEPNGDKFNELDAANSARATAALKAGFEDKIKNEIATAYSDSKSLGCDPLFIGRQFYRYAPDYFNGKYSLDNVTVEFDVQVALK